MCVEDVTKQFVETNIDSDLKDGWKIRQKLGWALLVIFFFLETVASLTIGKEGDNKSCLLIKAENMPPVKWIRFTFTVFADRFKTSLVV